MSPEELDSLKNYVGFTQQSALALARFHPLAEANFPLIIDDFYETIDRHEEARAAITGGLAQVDRLKNTLVEWLHSVFRGPHGTAYLESHARIGRVHVRINLPQQFMFSAMNRIRQGLSVVAFERVEDVSERTALISAINQILDIELAIMLDSYREDWLQRVRAIEQLATIGQLAASIGHELRNPLGIVESSLFLLGSRLAKLDVKDQTLDKHLSRISAQVQACSGTISDLLEMTRDVPPRRRLTGASEFVAMALDTVLFPQGISLERAIPAELSVYVDPQQIARVLANLLDNAIQAVREQGRISIVCQRAPVGTEIFVQDSGPGVPPNLRARIFDPLYTTKAHGTGLGLALCRKIVERHSGELSVTDSDEGACFRLWLPDPPPGESAQTLP
jgi:signal transduction histidine kinase